MARRAKQSISVENPFQFLVGEALDDGSNYEIIDHHKREADCSSGDTATPINRGGAGVVYRARFKDLDRAIKILAPRGLAESDTRDPALWADWPKYEATFQKEIRYLSLIRHTNIAKILDYGVCEGGPASGRPYYVMEYVDGLHFDKGVAAYADTASALLELLQELLEALQYLHAHSVMHADVKAENVYVQKVGARAHIVLLDLGVAKVVAADPTGHFAFTDDNELTYFFSTKEITREHRRYHLDREVSRSKLRGFFPDHDLHAFGHLLELTLRNKRVAVYLKRDLGASGWEALQLIKSRLLGPEQTQYKRVEDLSVALQRLEPTHLSPMGIPELAICANSVKAVAIPGGRVRLTERFVNLVNAPAFQRIRNITQLDFASLSYPGARHSRLLHSLGAYSLCREYIAHLLDDPRFRLLASKEDIEAGLVWALTHDVGHYPLAHMFEDLWEEERVSGGRRNVWMDDDLLPCFVLPSDCLSAAQQEVHSLLVKRLTDDKYDAAKWPARLIESGFGDAIVERLAELLGRQVVDPTAKIMRGLLDCPADVDKVSYLTMDSRMTGAEFGSGIDLDGLLAGLRCPGSRQLEDPRPCLAITDKGLSAAESVVLSRYWMIKRVYWHHANRAVMAMVKFTIEVLLATELMRCIEYICDSMCWSETEALNSLCNRWTKFQGKIAEALGGPAINPALGIIGGRREIYKRLVTIGSDRSDADAAVYELIALRGTRNLPNIRRAVSEEVQRCLGSRTPLPSGSVLIDVPTRQRERPGGVVWVYGDQSATEGEDLFDVSPVLGQMRNEFDRHVKKCRVFVSPELYERLSSSGKLDSARDRARSALRVSVESSA